MLLPKSPDDSFSLTSAFYRPSWSVGSNFFFLKDPPSHPHVLSTHAILNGPRFRLDATFMFSSSISLAEDTIISCLILHRLTCCSSWVSNYPLKFTSFDERDLPKLLKPNTVLPKTLKTCIRKNIPQKLVNYLSFDYFLHPNFAPFNSLDSWNNHGTPKWSKVQEIMPIKMEIDRQFPALTAHG